MDVAIAEPGAVAGFRERERKVGGDRGLADAALPAGDGDDVVDPVNFLRAGTRSRCGGHLHVHAHIHARNAGNRPHRALRLVADLLRHLRIAGRHHDPDRDVATGNPDFLNQPERNDVARIPGILDRAKRPAHVLFMQCCHPISISPDRNVGKPADHSFQWPEHPAQAIFSLKTEFSRTASLHGD